MTSTKMELIIWVTTSQIKEFHNISDKGISVDLEKIKSMIIKTCKIFCGTCRILQEVHFAGKIEFMYGPRKPASELVVPWPFLKTVGRMN